MKATDATSHVLCLHGLSTPLVLVDVDGVLNPSRPSPTEYRRHWVFPGGLVHRLSLNPGHGAMLTDLARETGAELVWGSYWRNRANTWIGPRIGLPPLRFVPIPTPRPSRWTTPGRWKAEQVAAWIGQVPFVWRRRPVFPVILRAARSGQHLVVTVDPGVGLTHDHVERHGRG
jgi:hypothetical protein